MKKSVMTAVILSLYCGSAFADDDPTFNGTVNGASCLYSTKAVCDPDGYCSAIHTGLGAIAEITFNIKRLMVMQPGLSINAPQELLTIKSVSPAKIGDPLILKFEAKLKDSTLHVTILLMPRKGLGQTPYIATSGIAVENPPTKEDTRTRSMVLVI